MGTDSTSGTISFMVKGKDSEIQKVYIPIEYRNIQFHWLSRRLG